MDYAKFAEVYEDLRATSKRLEKTSRLALFLKEIKKKGEPEWVYLLKGRVFAEYDPREFGISDKLSLKAIAKVSGISEPVLIAEFRKIGDLSVVAENALTKKKQSALFSKKLVVKKVFDNLQKLVTIEGKGAVEKKLGLIAELLNSASGKEAKYIIRTLLNDIRVGAADGVIRDAIAEAFFKEPKEAAKLIESAYDLANDYAVIFTAAINGENALKAIKITPGRPMKVMLPVKITHIEEGFRICGKPAALEHKYDGFRCVMNKDEEGNISLFTRRLEEVTNQFPDVVETLKKQVNAKSFILDGEIVGYDPVSGVARPFEAISQRIRRKYDIEKLVKELPVEVNVFDIMYVDKKPIENLSLIDRRKVMERIVKVKKNKIKLSVQFITDNEKEATKFYKEALKRNEEGIMIKKLDAPYTPGRRVGFMAKLKPDAKDLDLVITGAEHGTGKRAGWLTSYIVACKDGDKYLDVGKVASGLKEKSELGMSYEEMTKLITPLIHSEKGNVVLVKPKIVVSVTYQNMQHSPTYTSGFALRFPRITNYRPDRKPFDITTLNEIKTEVKRANSSRGLG